MALPTVFWVDEKLEDESHANAAPRHGAKPHEAYPGTRWIRLDLIEVMIRRCCLLRQKAFKLHSGERLGLVLGPAARRHVVRRMRGDHDADELVKPLRRHWLKDVHPVEVLPDVRHEQG